MDSCIEEGILKDMLIRQKTEVMHMLLTEFDEKKYKRSVYQDGYEDGVREGEISGFTKGEEHKMRELIRAKAAKGKAIAPFLSFALYRMFCHDDFPAVL